MKFSQIRPFIRFSRHLSLKNDSVFARCIPMDHRIFYAEKGTGKIWLADGTVTTERGSFLYLPAGTPYRLLPGAVEYIAVNFDFFDLRSDLNVPIPPINVRQNTSYQLIETVNFEDIRLFHDRIFLPGWLSLSERMNRLNEICAKELPFSALQSSALLTEILAETAQRTEISATRISRFSLDEIVDYIHQHYNEPLTNEKIASEFHFHPNYISAEFAKNLGKPLHRYLLELRVRKAITMIEAGKRDMEQIAQDVGFSDRNYFSRYFKQITGISPTAYLKRQ